jgi:hypothetical protein
MGLAIDSQPSFMKTGASQGSAIQINMTKNRIESHLIPDRSCTGGFDGVEEAVINKFGFISITP